MPSSPVTFPGHDGHTLSASLTRPDGPQQATALFAHCFTCSKDIPAARRIAARLAASGIAVLRFDFTGLGQSGGAFENTSFATNLEDLRAAAAWMEGEGMAPDLLIGHSLGGAAVLKVAADIPSARAVVTIGAPFDPAHVTQHFSEDVEKICAEGEAMVDLGGRPFTIKRQFIEDIAVQDLRDAVSHLKRALLILHAPRDSIVGIDNAADIFLAAKHPKSFVTLDNADHLITRPEDAEYAAGVIAAWAAHYLDLSQPTAPEGAPEGIARISEADPDGFLQDISVGPKHHLLADEPVKYGGTDRGLSPYGFLTAGLGACTSMTIRMYARRKKWPLTHVSVDVSHAKVHAEDAEGDKPSKIDRFERVITLQGDLDAEQRQRLLEIADRCPVHRTLEQSNLIETRLAD
ncbi:bifunctional alpha/beta hydrolase/OsmC family protein [Rhodalgimonas zhirmunskyi]|uniref:Bifunctional alpha/beta hydrolase/OsmC family protein n=1 Tax=Rhodalgimonas zhirmunskyi TaxID=2964767 RepID=A0AAJ1UFX1_9RHOB|nr:bifunctional alpha/beta hydrolase/OsmC family protein [Rhodoalgimonas zhirmunskyi]MDQ2095177.1 bifunctional alpha/beta hydrolase/OsmC family protein [Rhodoalgimonas zhirmunskyi]